MGEAGGGGVDGPDGDPTYDVRKGNRAPRHETPAHGDEFALAVALDDRVDRIGRTDVVASLGIPGRLVGRQTIETDQLFPSQLVGKATAHEYFPTAAVPPPGTRQTPSCRQAPMAMSMLRR